MRAQPGTVGIQTGVDKGRSSCQLSVCERMEGEWGRGVGVSHGLQDYMGKLPLEKLLRGCPATS